jgi:hypothetical protein
MGTGWLKVSYQGGDWQNKVAGVQH